MPDYFRKRATLGFFLSLILASMAPGYDALAQDDTAKIWARIKTRDDFARLLLERTPGYLAASEAGRECLVDVWDEVMPEDAIAAIDKFLADKTEENWAGIQEIDRQTDWAALAPKMEQAGLDCRAKTGG
nr:hypothetical protein [uncultured Dongia sp.]